MARRSESICAGSDFPKASSRNGPIRPSWAACSCSALRGDGADSDVNTDAITFFVADADRLADSFNVGDAGRIAVVVADALSLADAGRVCLADALYFVDPGRVHLVVTNDHADGHAITNSGRVDILVANLYAGWDVLSLRHAFPGNVANADGHSECDTLGFGDVNPDAVAGVYAGVPLSGPVRLPELDALEVADADCHDRPHADRDRFQHGDGVGDSIVDALPGSDDQPEPDRVNHCFTDWLAGLFHKHEPDRINDGLSDVVAGRVRLFVTGSHSFADASRVRFVVTDDLASAGIADSIRFVVPDDHADGGAVARANDICRFVLNIHANRNAVHTPCIFSDADGHDEYDAHGVDVRCRDSGALGVVVCK